MNGVRSCDDLRFYGRRGQQRGMSKYNVDDLSNKVDVGSQPGTMWSLSSQKPGHGLAELRDPSSKKLWQSDGLLPHMINIQFSRRTAVTHVSIYTDFREDDSYTPSKIRIMAGTHFHDLVEVRTRELREPTGWKHFVLEKADFGNESDEPDSDCSSSAASQSDDHSDLSMDDAIPLASSGHRRRGGATKRGYLRRGVSKKHAPISVFLIQICVLSNHAAGKDTHIRGIHVFGPPTKESRQRAKRLAEKGAAKTDEGVALSRLQAAAKEEEERIEARQSLQRWVTGQDEGLPGDDTRAMEGEEDAYDLSAYRIPTSRRLDMLSTLR